MIESSQNKQSLGWRLFAVLAVLGLVCLAFIARAVYLHVYDSDFLKKQGDKRHIRVLTVAAERGEIHDRNGELLAASAPVHSIWCDPQEIASYFETRQGKLDEFEKKQKEFDVEIQHLRLMAQRQPEQRQQYLAQAKRFEKKQKEYVKSISDSYQYDSLEPLAAALKMPLSSLKQRLKDNINSHFVFLKRRIPPAIADAVKKVDFPGVATQLEYRRFYPSGDVFAPLIGFTDIDDNGQDGIERRFNDELAGESGSRRVIRDRTFNEIADIGVVEEANPGAVLNLSIDSRFQYVLHKELSKAMVKHSADKAMGVLVNPWSGEVLAMVSLPSFNPNALKTEDRDDWHNKAVRDLIEPGSIMKPLIVAAGLEYGAIEPDELIETPYYLSLKGGKVTNKYAGDFSLDDIISKSMNVGMAKIVGRIPDRELLDYLAKLGFGMQSSVEYSVKPEGFLPVSPLKEFDKATLSYGYGLNTSALHLAAAYSVLATDGKLRPLTLIKDKHSQNQRYVFSKTVTDRVKQMLVKTVASGTAKAAQVDGYTVAGKTGTADKIDKRTGKYNKELVQTAFAGYAPAANPEFVLVVVIDNPKGNHVSAGKVAAPVFAETMKQVLPLAGVMPVVQAHVGGDNG